MRNIDTLAYHIENPNVSVETYVRQKRIELAHEIKPINKIYLDTNFWVRLRDARLGRGTGNDALNLLHILEKLTAKGIAICPISSDTFAEIFKQTDFNTLGVSAQLIDDLSKGVVLLSMKERIDLEVIHFVREKSKGVEHVYTLDEMVWTKIAYVFGFCTPTSKALPPDLDCAIQKAFFDQFWVITLADRLEQMGEDVLHRIPKLSDISQKLNDGKFSHADECKSFKQLFLAELSGILDVYRSDFQGLIRYLYESETGQSLNADEISSDDSGQTIANLIYHAFRLNKIKSELPSFRISAGIHAVIRWDKERKYKPTDLHDFHHAAAAIPYCDYFLTERSLGHLVQNKNLKLEKFFNCKIISDISEAIDELSRINS